MINGFGNKNVELYGENLHIINQYCEEHHINLRVYLAKSIDHRTNVTVPIFVLHEISF